MSSRFRLRVILANAESTKLVFFGDPLEQSGAGNAWYGCDPAVMLEALSASQGFDR
jgi:hypothetical protein